jgi:outer membrane protein assembly factor BamA
VEAGVVLPFRKIRVTHQLLASVSNGTTTYSTSESRESQRRVAARAGWSMRTARLYGYSISPEHGVAMAATAEMSGNGVGNIDDTTTLTADIRGYLPGVGTNHVVALRSAAGVSTGARDVSRLFRLGGGAGDAEPLDFGRRAIGLLRGFAPDSFAGTRVALANLEYRAPVARIERGLGTWPIFLHTIHGALFADAAHAWTGQFRKDDVKFGLGAELSANVVAGYSLPLTLTVGAAWGHDGAGRIADGVSTYVRIGRAF